MQLEKEFLEQVEQLYGVEGKKQICKAFEFASKKHFGQKKENGADHITHPYNVAKILVGMKADVSAIVFGFIHECLEYTDCTGKEILDNFGPVVYNLAINATRLEIVKKARVKNPEETENLRKLILSLGKDARIAFVKLADRLHTMQTLEYRTKERQLETAQETLDIYVPIAEQLGMNRFKHNLEDLCFKYVFPEEYEEINNYLEQYKNKSENIIVDITNRLNKMLKEHKIEATIQSRVKSAFGVFKKIKKKGINSVYDVIALRIIVKEIKDCYTMLGSVHNVWKPIEGRIKDYIATPKKNFYRSLHTTVMYPTETGFIPFEIQIRTEDMHIYCEYGMAAHWMYKEHGSVATSQQGNEALFKMKNSMASGGGKLLEQNETEDVLQTVKTGFYSNKVFVFSPNLNVVELPEGAIPLDFAYSIHSNLGNKCVGAKINDKMVPITTKLKTGDIVEILTSANTNGPSRDWLKICKSKSAITKIKSYFKKEKREENIKIGKEMLEEAAKRKGYVLSKLFEDKEIMLEIAVKHHLISTDEIFAAVGYGGITVAQVLGKFIAKQQQLEKKEKKLILQTENLAHKTNDGIIIDGHDDLLKKVAKCCSPIPGDDIVGYVSRGKGVTIHRRDCLALKNLEQDRIVETTWNSKSLSEVYTASLRVIAKNSAGLFNEISTKIADEKIDITFINADVSKTGDANVSLGVKIKSRGQLIDLINKIKSIPNVYDVYR